MSQSLSARFKMGFDTGAGDDFFTISFHDENGFYHNENGPALPALINEHRKEWWIHGKRHRENGPAVKWDDGYEAYYLNGDFHKEDISERLKKVV